MGRMQNDKLNKGTDNKGITLVEVLISIAILGIVSTMISTILMSGTNFFRKQSVVIDLQNDSQLIMTSMTTALLESTQIVIDENRSMAGKTVTYIATGDVSKTPEANQAVAKQYVWDKDSYCLYVYDAGVDLSSVTSFNKGNCLSEYVYRFSVTSPNKKEVKDQDGNVTYEVNCIEVDFTLRKNNQDIEQNFIVKPRNTSVGIN